MSYHCLPIRPFSNLLSFFLLFLLTEYLFVYKKMRKVILDKKIHAMRREVQKSLFVDYRLIVPFFDSIFLHSHQ